MEAMMHTQPSTITTAAAAQKRNVFLAENRRDHSTPSCSSSLVSGLSNDGSDEPASKSCLSLHRIRSFGSGSGSSKEDAKGNNNKSNNNNNKAKMNSVATMTGSAMNSDLGPHEPEVFLRNPKTGGFDYTPAQHVYHSFADREASSSGKRKERERYYNNDRMDETLNDSTVYTSYTKKPLLPRNHSSSNTETTNQNNNKSKQVSKNKLSSFHRYFHLKASKTPNASTPASPPGADNCSIVPVTPSPTRKPKKSSSILKQLRSFSSLRVSGNNNPTTPTPKGRDTFHQRRMSSTYSESSSSSSSGINPEEYYNNELVRKLGPSRVPANAQAIMNSRSRRTGRLPMGRAEAMLITPPRSGRSPRSFKQEEVLISDVDDSFFVGSKSPFCAAESLVSSPFPDCGAGEEASCASSVLDFSFSTVGARPQDDDKAWSFDAVSPVMMTCGRTTTIEVHSGSDESVEVSTIFEQDSGFDADNDKSDYRTAAKDEDAVSMTSKGALLLTEEGLKKHNDQAEENEQAPLTLRQPNGVGKLEKQVLQQKIQRLQAKEAKKQAEDCLEEERAARKQRHLRARQQNFVPANGEYQEEEEYYDREGTSQKRNSPPRSSPTKTNRSNDVTVDDSISPNTSVGQSTMVSSPTPSPKKRSSSSFLKKVLVPWKKKSSPEELKRQWKERERERVQMAQKEGEEAERKERERIKERRQSYLREQRELEQRSKSQTELDVDAYIAERARQRQHVRYYCTQDESPLDAYFGNNTNHRKNKKRGGSESGSTHSHHSVTMGSLADLGSLTTATTTPLGPCIVCQTQERTHISMPCMHFAFCEGCVKNQTMCPMCTAENVTFSRVNTE